MAQLLTVGEAAGVLKLAPATVRKMILRRQLPVVRPSARAVRLRAEDVDAITRIGLAAFQRALARREEGR